MMHLTSEPISVRDIAQQCFNIAFDNQLANEPAKYDFRTEFAHLYNSTSVYQYSQKEAILAIRSYAQSEQKKDL